MEKIIKKDQPIGEIATIFPKATNIFMEYEIDFCCGGDRKLEVAIAEKNIDENELLDKLNTEYQEMQKSMDKDVDWQQESMSNLIDYIVNKHHAFMKEEMPVTERFVSKILQVHYLSHGDVLVELHKLFNQLKTEIAEHLIKEEEVLFPLIKEYENNPSEKTLEKALKVLEETESEHDVAGDILKDMRKLTKGFKVPEDGCNTYRVTYEKIEAIEKDLFQHIHLENNILFNRLK
ncbi:iron-sulfur cluster repair di-iron protein [Clostridium sp. D2Q-11]|uniref:Iron-sulfur cluster repair di-iron protein n=1 Tax=Anaeromonas frigoriresistens TaxID=2683708 RepID=A0A942UXY9_9FIRM|nr:iron-sulfur cluster repair di-iron protein [Anaeromonas frigoriresistens]MBS4538864.1 iron-sulfur cluster repair di-iron protein [Anaeromonas frigoriresistens]